MPLVCTLQAPLLPTVTLSGYFRAVSSEDWYARCILETDYPKFIQKELGNTALSLYTDQQKGYFIAGIYFMLSKGEHTLNKLKLNFIGFHLPGRGNYFAG